MPPTAISRRDPPRGCARQRVWQRFSMRHVPSEHRDAVLATGDIAQLPSSATYELFLTTLARYYSGPLLCVPGNHDHGVHVVRRASDRRSRVRRLRLAGVDTHVDDVVGGTVQASELSRLRATLLGCAARQRTLVAGHHCPVEIGCSWLDAHRIDNGDDLLDVLRAADAVGYVFGHIHQEVEADPGVPIFGTPSTCFQFSDDSPTFGIDTAKPGYRWLTLETGWVDRVGRSARRRLRTQPGLQRPGQPMRKRYNATASRSPENPLGGFSTVRQGGASNG